ncbi:MULTISPECIES: TenA family protein [unclassified Burkholderia]|uniref:TenA family protein n=1 Tax=unclassified Burkholderia TaxID=2613784 RepID=UPI0005BAC6D0|nr:MULTISPECIES: TenA family protein [unclassified Burkholderia]NIF87888.1 transcriptional regulator [Burkholderia sp. Cy-637]
MMEHPSHSARLRAHNLAHWDAMQAHRFVADIQADALPDAVFANYLRYEHRFVETAVTIFGHALVKAPDFASKRWLAGVLHALATEQIPYFEAMFARLGITALPPEAVLPEPVRAFDRGMLEIAANGSYHDAIVAMMCAEWMYSEWCGAAARKTISHPGIRAWVDLHADEAFTRQALWLREQIDSIPDEHFDFAGANAVFAKALALEIDFHSAAYQ